MSNFTRGWSIEAKIAFYSEAANDGTGCILWKASTAAGYGHIWHEGRLQRVTRILLSKKLGRPIKPGMQACHSCHRPSCVNENHLREDTAKANAADRIAAGNNRYGVCPLGQSPVAKLSTEQILPILQDPRNYSEIAREYKVSRSVISSIKNRELWRRIELPDGFKIALSPCHAPAIRALLEAGK